MIITTIEELRLQSPAHALDSIDGMVGFIDNSEHEFLAEKLGQPLYDELCRWYDANPITRSTVEDYMTGYWNRLLLVCQRCVAFDALGRAAGMQVVSVNNSGINQMTADDYKTADKDSVDTYRQTCVKEAHSALNRLLTMLEEWTKEAASVVDGSPIDEELQAITEKWKASRYYYRSTASLIPTALCLQDYLNIYDNREKFIQMLPDLLFIQEEQVAPAIGEDFLQWLIAQSLTEEVSPLVSRIIHRLRKVMAALLVGRTAVIKYQKDQKIQAHDDGVRMLDVACTYIRNQQPAILEALGPDHADIFKSSPLYVEPAPAPSSSPVPDASASIHHCGCATHGPTDRAACWTPPLM